MFRAPGPDGRRAPPFSRPARMIVQRFLTWVQTAPVGARAEATSALARAYLYNDLADRDRADAESALTAMLDDRSPLVRRALAEAFASAREAPHHCISALACDQSDIAAVVLARSPLLSDAELVDCAAVGDAFAQSAIALRPCLSSAVARALAEVGAREAVISLAVNPAAEVPDAALRRIIERFGDDGEVREALLTRPDLSAGVRADLVLAATRALSAFVSARGWMAEERMKRVGRESCEKGFVIIAGDAHHAPDAWNADLARRLRLSGQLTPHLALRALLSGARALFEAMLVELTGLPASRVAGLVGRFEGSAFAALCKKAGFPASLLPAFRAGLAGDDQESGLTRTRVARARAALRSVDPSVDAAVMAGLRRLESEAAREEARQASAELIDAAAAREARLTAEALLASTAPVVEIDLAAIEAELFAA